MDVSEYLLSRVVWATTPPGETESDAQSRAETIAAMLRAYDPGDGMEAMMACQCVMMQFLLNAAMRDASNPHQEPAVVAKARAGAISASRTLHQWITKFENSRKRNELRAAEAAKTQAAAQSAADRPSQPPPAEPVPQPDPSQPNPPQRSASPLDRPLARMPAPIGHAAAVTGSLDPLSAAAAAVRAAASGLGLAGSGAPNAPPPSLPAKLSNAA
jgi:hypothetical protein